MDQVSTDNFMFLLFIKLQTQNKKQIRQIEITKQDQEVICTIKFQMLKDKFIMDSFGQQNPQSIPIMKKQQDKILGQNVQSKDNQKASIIDQQIKKQKNNYQYPFNLSVKQKYNEQLKHQNEDNSCELFYIIVNQIIQENFHNNLNNFQQITQNLNSNNHLQSFQVKEEFLKGPQFIQKLKSQDQSIKRKIKLFLKSKVHKRPIQYKLDPNKDKGFLLAKKMNEINQQRQRKYKQNLANYKNTIKNIQQSSNKIQFGENLSTKLDSVREYSNSNKNIKPNNVYKTIFPKISHLNNTQNIIQNRKIKQYQLNEGNLKITTPYIQKLNTTRDQILKNDEIVSFKQRNMLRQIQILRKSKIISGRYQIKKFILFLIYELLSKSVNIVQTKRQFFFKAPPRPIHQMIKSPPRSIHQMIKGSPIHKMIKRQANHNKIIKLDINEKSDTNDINESRDKNNTNEKYDKNEKHDTNETYNSQQSNQNIRINHSESQQNKNKITQRLKDSRTIIHSFDIILRNGEQFQHKNPFKQQISRNQSQQTQKQNDQDKISQNKSQSQEGQSSYSQQGQQTQEQQIIVQHSSQGSQINQIKQDHQNTYSLN